MKTLEVHHLKCRSQLGHDMMSNLMTLCARLPRTVPWTPVTSGETVMRAETSTALLIRVGMIYSMESLSIRQARDAVIRTLQIVRQDRKAMQPQGPPRRAAFLRLQRARRSRPRFEVAVLSLQHSAANCPAI
jgi:hypothetical protein